MRHTSRYARLLPMLIALAGNSGCIWRGAPSFVFFGAYFPAWMLMAGMGILLAIAARAWIVAAGLTQAVPMQLLVCVSAGLTLAIVLWAVWFGA